VVLAKFRQLHDVEDRAKATSPDERLAFRQTEAAPIWTSLGERPTSSRSSAVRSATTSTSGRTSRTCSTNSSPVRPTTTGFGRTSGRRPLRTPSAPTAGKNAATGPTANTSAAPAADPPPRPPPSRRRPPLPPLRKRPENGPDGRLPTHGGLSNNAVGFPPIDVCIANDRPTWNGPFGPRLPVEALRPLAMQTSIVPWIP